MFVPSVCEAIDNSIHIAIALEKGSRGSFGASACLLQHQLVQLAAGFGCSLTRFKKATRKSLMPPSRVERYRNVSCG